MFFVTANNQIISVIEDHYSSIEILVDDLKNQSKSWKEPIVFLAGHFMLMYSFKLDRLVPMVIDELDDPQEKFFVMKKVGTFPRDSLEIACKIMEDLPKFSTRIAILVNDHQFLRFQSNIPKERAGKLRRLFYRTYQEVLPSFLEILKKYNLDAKSSILCNDKPPRTGRGILPKITPYFSEYNLRNIFQDKTIKQIIAEHANFEVLRYNRLCHVLYCPSPNKDPIMLTEDGRHCACSGEIVQFFLEISKDDNCPFPEHHGGRPVATSILIIPEECAKAVYNGILAAMDIIPKLDQVLLIYGLENAEYISVINFQRQKEN